MCKIQQVRMLLELQLWELKKHPEPTKIYQLTVNTLCELIGNQSDKFCLFTYLQNKSQMEKSGYGVLDDT